MTARILIVEDNPANLELMAYLLKAFGHSVECAENGFEGIAALSQGQPDLIVCDMQLPEMDGYQFLSEIKKNPTWSNIPVLAVTALAMVGDRDKVLSAGFDGYFAKPINPESFVQQVEAFLNSEKHGKGPVGIASNQSTFTSNATTAPLILIVDNLAVNRDLAMSLLEPNGFNVVMANSGGQALELARERSPSLILSDVNMADGSGFDLLIAVRRDPLLCDIPFVLITSTCDNERDRTKGLALGASSYLFRPVEPHALLDEIRLCLQRNA